MSHPTSCLNCATLLTADDHFCPNCGQKTDTHRLTMSHIWHDIGHAFTHTDKGFFYTIKELAVRPGRVAREYVQGKRKKYFNPFSFLIIIVGIHVLSNTVFQPYSRGIESFPKSPPASIRTEEQKKKWAAAMYRMQKWGQFINNKTNLVLFISTPFIAAVLWLLFRRKHLYYAEHLATMAYVNGFLSLLTIFIFGPLLYFSKGTLAHTPIYILMMLSHVIYVGIIYHGFLGYTSGKAYWKTIGGGLVAILAWAVLSMAVGMYYIRYGF
jgi:Protein of unknown function (DUF3667)